VQFSALDIIELLSPTLLLVIAGTAAETFDQSQRAYDRAREPKELFLVEGGTHFNFYDRPEFVVQLSKRSTLSSRPISDFDG
jgi:fermentation-respiration switch protein FrsA (DUF1100 family)